MNHIGFIFDMDGVIVDSMRTHEKAWLALFADLGLKIDLKEFHYQTAGMTGTEVLRHFLGNRFSDAELAQLSAQKEFLYRVLFRKKLKATKGLLAFLKAAETLKIPMALATGGGKANIDFILDGLSIRTYFQSVLGAGDVKHGKPNPEIYLKSADALGLLPEQCFVFEDALPGIEAAHRAGMRIIGIATTHCVAFLRKVPGVIVAAKNFERLSPKQFLSLRAET
ncbi:MAG: beta-phosphoglucomutase family hydrolase [Candidatus Thermochlorobacter aerophilum]|jgi:beta-phosphoglucomutase|uniref:Beta-phosphoglucomutase n=1 Tax=Candidatus Thermochlorobacter aerophilus TaxID=1868324 RepID=A0A395M0P7_9BACT|nr:MAG: beta-phosphoglucomutase family hydrolase [Candidatus Thermochlorobacter aerophilum]